jgi:hypothetical protein
MINDEVGSIELVQDSKYLLTANSVPPPNRNVLPFFGEVIIEVGQLICFTVFVGVSNFSIFRNETGK